ncbi:MAG: EamA family transporter [Gammaproteobacteria bacterium]|nr:EamA family transporter [Gammaproteobacteria bacterium]
MHALLPLAAMVFITLAWGYSWVLNKVALAAAGPFTFSAWRMSIASLFLLAALALTRRHLVPARVPELLRLGLLQTTGFVGISMWALVEGSIGRTAILVFTMPFWTVAFAWPVLGERIRDWQWLALGLAFAGLVSIVQPWDLQGSLLSKVLAVSSGIAWAASSVEIKRMQRKAPIDLLSLTTWQMIFGTGPLWLIAHLTGEPATAWSWEFAIILFVLASVSTALCWFLWIYALKHLHTGAASMGMLAIPVVALISAHWTFGEQASPAEYLGFALIGAALAVLSGRSWIRQREEVTPVVAQD